MKLIDLIAEYERKLEQPSNYYSCLLFALQLPSICSRIEFPQTIENTGKLEDGKLYRRNGKTWDSNLYKFWVKTHKKTFEDIYSTSISIDEFSDSLYELRCYMTHEGILNNINSQFYFTDVADEIMSIGNIIFIPITTFCEEMFELSKIILLNNNMNFDITLFEKCFMSKDNYLRIKSKIKELYATFWKDYSEEDLLLYQIYTIIFKNNNNNNLDNIKVFFDKNPNEIFKLQDINLNYGIIIDTKQTFIKKDNGKDETNRNSDVLYLSKENYEQMLFINQELEDYSKNNPFDITNYLKEINNANN